MRPAYTYDDVLLVPQYSDLDSRSDVDISVELPFMRLSVPVISAAMDTITGIEMQKAMQEHGGLGIHHRYNMSKEDLADTANFGPIAVAPSMGIDFLQFLVDTRKKTVVKIDVAHGDSKHAIEYAERAAGLGLGVISGNVVTPDAALSYLGAGVKAICVGIGPGALCSTRLVAGVGYPQLSAIMEIKEMVGSRASIVADGGIKYSGDIVKALAAGADAVIIGTMFGGTYEAPGEIIERGGHKYKQVRGMASREALESAGKEVNPEGVSGYVPLKGSVVSILNELESGIRAGFAYLGARNLKELRQNAEWRLITQNGINEGQPRI